MTKSTQPQRLYNEYAAFDPKNLPLFEDFEDAISDLIQKLTDHDFDLRDAQNYATQTVSVAFSEAVLRRAMKLNKQKREESKHD